MMNPEIKATWIAALRSGEYQQGFEYLNTGGKFCCLGVLCDLAVKAGVLMDVRVKQNVPWDDLVTAYNDHHRFLPNIVRIWSGLNDGELIDSLINKNDDGMPFDEIASYIQDQA